MIIMMQHNTDEKQERTSAHRTGCVGGESTKLYQWSTRVDLAACSLLRPRHDEKHDLKHDGRTMNMPCIHQCGFEDNFIMLFPRQGQRPRKRVELELVTNPDRNTHLPGVTTARGPAQNHSDRQPLHSVSVWIGSRVSFCCCSNALQMRTDPSMAYAINHTRVFVLDLCTYRTRSAVTPATIDSSPETNGLDQSEANPTIQLPSSNATSIFKTRADRP